MTQRNTLNNQQVSKKTFSGKITLLSVLGKASVLEAALLGAKGQEDRSLDEQISNAEITSAAPESQSCKYTLI